jgi:L-aspartate oxidase
VLIFRPYIIIFRIKKKQQVAIMQECDVLIIGCGLAGTVAALELADKGFSIILLGTDANGRESNSCYAQGGIVCQGIEDSTEWLMQDVLQAGAGLCNPKAVEILSRLGPSYIKSLLIDKYGVDFDRNDRGEFSLTQEGAHSCPRILHCKDTTGISIMQALFKQIKQRPHIKWLNGYTAVDLITLSHHSKKSTDIYLPSTCVGAYVMDNDKGEVEIYFAKETVLATGGLGEVFLHTTNPKSARGDGVAMAFRAGARIMNMEYIQFHPTSFYYPGEKRVLLSEALRGEGAKILSKELSPFLHRYHEKAELAPRDVVSRSIYQEMLKTDTPHLWMDISFKEASWLKDRFPANYSFCLSKGVDLTKEPVPIVPAAHYSCGGIAVDEKGRTTIHRLRAIGEVACTGVHGANRLASTSLLEALIWGKSCADDLDEELPKRSDYFPPVEDWVMSEENVDRALIQQDWMTIKQTMWNYVGLVRDHHRLSRAVKMLQELKWEIESFYERGRLTPELLGLRNGIQTALLITQGALRNKHSLGCHFRMS